MVASFRISNLCHDLRYSPEVLHDHREISYYESHVRRYVFTMADGPSSDFIHGIDDVQTSRFSPS